MKSEQLELLDFARYVELLVRGFAIQSARGKTEALCFPIKRNRTVINKLSFFTQFPSLSFLITQHKQMMRTTGRVRVFIFRIFE